ncbi:hypothetical protein DL771_009397 [Monosporascus sp. 5C6A]|nr:hypothetical protein DL771_009397 [Monosporascus sp. 5C6A]
MQFITILLALPALAMSMSMAYPPGMCISGPSFALEAGVSVLAAVINGDFNQRCAATVGFADPDFLPVSRPFHEATAPRDRWLRIGNVADEYHTQYHYQALEYPDRDPVDSLYHYYDEYTGASPKTPPSTTDTAPPGTGTQTATGENISENLPTPTLDIKTESLYQGSRGAGSSTTTGTFPAIAASLLSTITVMQTVTSCPGL